MTDSQKGGPKMLQFYGEEKRTAEIQNNLAEFFNLAERIHIFWLTGEKTKWHNESKLPPIVTNVCAIIDVQALRKFRSIVEECSRGEARNAAIIARSLFETLLAQTFVLKRKLAIIIQPHPDPRFSGEFKAYMATDTRKPTATDWLSREFRAQLYMSFLVPLTEKGLKKLSEGRKRLTNKADKLNQTVGKLIEAEMLKNIGPEWMSIQRTSGQYSGFKIAELARVLRKDLKRWYESPYHFQSNDAHAVNYKRYFDVNEKEGRITAKYFCTDREIREVMIEGMLLMLMIIAGQQKNMFRNPEIEQSLQSLVRSFRKLRPE